MAYVELGNSIDGTMAWTSPEICHPMSYDWNLIFCPLGFNADYKITLEVSDDKVCWATYKLDGEVIDHTVNSLIIDDILPGEWFRVKFDPDTNSAGTFDVTFNAKRHP